LPTRRAHIRRNDAQITEADAEAFIAGEGLALHRALRLKPWQFALSPTAERARTVAEIMQKRVQIEAELHDWERRRIFSYRWSGSSCA
jgi:hypothetical protein